MISFPEEIEDSQASDFSKIKKNNERRRAMVPGGANITAEGASLEAASFQSGGFGDSMVERRFGSQPMRVHKSPSIRDCNGFHE